MGNCVGREASASGGLTRSSLSLSTSSSTSSRDSMELVESRRQQEEARALEGRPHPEGGGPCATPEMDAAFAEAFGAGARPQDYSDIKKNLAKRGTLAFGAARKQSPSPRGSFEHEEKMPLQTLKMGKRRRNLFSAGSKGDDGDDGDEGGDMELGESSQLEFQKVLRMWQEEKRRRKKEARRGASFLDSLKKLGSKADAKAGGRKKKKKEKLMMWETFLHSKHVTKDNPAWRHAQQTYSSTRVQEKVEYLFASIDTNGVGFLEKHEFMFMLDGLRGRMHHFLRNTKALYFRSPDQDEVVPADQEFVLSEDFKNSLVGAIQSELFTWRATPHAWAVDKDLFENLVTLIFCSTVHLIMTDEGKSAVDVPVAIEFYLLMSTEGILKPIGHDQVLESKKSLSQSSESGSLSNLASSLFCRTIFDLHMICPPQSTTYVDETVLECEECEENPDCECQDSLRD